MLAWDAEQDRGGERIRLNKRVLATVAAAAVLIMSIALVVSMIGGDDNPDITTDLPDEQLPDSNPEEGVDDGSNDDGASDDEGTGDDDQSSDDEDDDDVKDDEEDPSDPDDQQVPPYRHRHANRDGNLVRVSAPMELCSNQQDDVQREAIEVGDGCPNGESMGSQDGGLADGGMDDADGEDGQGEEQHQEQESASQQANGNTYQSSQ